MRKNSVLYLKIWRLLDNNNARVRPDRMTKLLYSKGCYKTECHCSWLINSNFFANSCCPQMADNDHNLCILPNFNFKIALNLLFYSNSCYHFNCRQSVSINMDDKFFNVSLFSRVFETFICFEFFNSIEKMENIIVCETSVKEMVNMHLWSVWKSDKKVFLHC